MTPNVDELLIVLIYTRNVIFVKIWLLLEFLQNI